MCCVIFSEPTDWSTHDVIDWLVYLKCSYKRIDINSILSSPLNFDFSDNKNSKIFLNTEIKIEDIHSLWYRRTVPININKYKAKIENNEELLNSILNHQFDELKHTKNAFLNLTSDKKWLNIPATSIIDKTECLVQAKKCNMIIPETIITNNKKDLLVFKKKVNKIIVKPIYNITILKDTKYSYLQYTYELKKNNISKLSDTFFPTLAQEMIEKEIELRVFFLNGKIYPMALFSQKNEQTKSDFRRYDYKNPTRTVPYKLPEDLEVKIRLFMNTVNLNSGSLDFILGKNNIYYFLEVNPVGQFGMTSYPCNYYIEKDIAKYLNE
ncbi:MAG: grasp-with-spasm system ATP-grasp peptide maturase [Bacteroidota bacterium]